MAQSNNLLLAIGIDKYNTSPNFPPLNNAVSDAKRLIEILEDKYNFKQEKYLFNEEATTIEITNALVELKHLHSQDNLIIFFSGHGTEDPDTHKGQLVPVNAKNRADFISFSTIRNEFLECIKAKHILLIFDCCYSGNFIARSRGDLSISIDKIYDKPSRYFLGSGGTEKVSDGKIGESSPFMKSLLGFLDFNTKNTFITTELALHLRTTVGNTTQQQPVYEPIDMDGHCSGEFIFVLDNKYIQDIETNNNYESIEYPELKEEFETYLADIGAKYFNSRKDNITISDIFIEPNLKLISLEKQNLKNVQYERLWSIIDSRNKKNQIKLLITGSETSGKTTICKRIFDRYYQEGFIPILLNGKDDIVEIKKDKFLLNTKRIFHKQYKSLNYEQLDKNRIILIIDDFHKFKSTKNNDFRDVLIKNINSYFSNVIVIGDSLMPFMVLPKDNKLKNIFNEYSAYQLVEFGPKLRHELIEKWYCIGQEKEFIDKNELFRWYDEREQQIRSIIGKNYMPAYPFYILTIIQTLESNNLKPEYSLHGFYYQHLIDKQFNESVKNKEDISLYYNYITEFCFFLFYEVKQNSVSISSFIEFHNFYCNKYAVTYNYQNILKNLKEAKILNVNGNVRVQYKYIYYFFIAKYLTNNLSKAETKGIVSKMSQRLYIEEYANIIMFLTHLSKDPFIIYEILNNAKNIFSENNIAKLGHDIEGLNKIIKSIPNQVIELVNAENVRNEELEEKEEVELLEKEYEAEKEDVNEYDLNENVDSINFISKINLSLKTIEILGQLVKKYWGSMDKQEKVAIAEETYFLGLRTLGAYLNLVQSNSDLIVEFVKEIVLQKNIKNKFSLKKTAEDTANDFIFRLCFLSSYSVIKRVGNSVGYPKLYPVFDEILKNNKFNSIKLIDLSIHLDHEGKIPFDKIKEVSKELNGNKLGSLVLRNLVLDRLYYFDEGIGDMQKLSNILGIPIQQQRYINATSRIKKE